MPINKRNIAKAIILSIITCGIYQIYWFVVLTDETKAIAGDSTGASGGMAFLFDLITCGIYGFYWAYKQGERLDYSKNLRGIPSGNSNILYLILQIIGLGIVAQALMQDSVNKILDFDSMNNNNGSVNA